MEIVIKLIVEVTRCIYSIGWLVFACAIFVLFKGIVK